VSTTIATRLGWTGWLLVLVYFGALTAISDYIAHWFLFSEELLFYEVLSRSLFLLLFSMSLPKYIAPSETKTQLQNGGAGV